MIEITETAAQKIRTLMAKQGIDEGGLRVGVKGGGCSGLRYIFAWEREARLVDEVFEGADGTTLLVYRRPAGNKAEHTQVRFWSTDIGADVAELAGRGVVFEQYDTPTFKTVDHVVTTPGIGSSAWFRDPDGNTIAVFQPA